MNDGTTPRRRPEGLDVMAVDPADHHLRPRWSGTLVKRAFDIVVGSMLFVASLPVLIVLASVLAFQLRGWPFFVHKRVGRGGRPITFPKLRTLSRDTPRYADKTMVEFHPVSRLAAVLRDKHLDELPQLVLVPLGLLSLVGPRPRMANEVDQYPFPPFDVARTTVRQGCTGLWQVGAHTVATVSASPEYDLHYLRHSSFRMDLWILWRTVAQAFGGRGVTLVEVPRAVRGRGLVVIDDPAWASMIDVDGPHATSSHHTVSHHEAPVFGTPTTATASFEGEPA
ncbi:MAG: hypothetical protein AVDCRST_MAG76-1024 [uncultured Acidimicrobiales bacterium]|uniref:Bacterial sugar transferase domain-containing protein n=1 Tax=uncultured Acidimicrobiales bacterium TaxID=310071 RepID=A0A6J4HLX1_9ACTN|nr:MAG: hypothetical protein AVDCRST_MAG76-1024 [uncultured Acidimicrobiales bacterium]